MRFGIHYPFMPDHIPLDGGPYLPTPDPCTSCGENVLPVVKVGSAGTQNPCTPSQVESGCPVSTNGPIFGIGQGILNALSPSASLCEIPPGVS
jgi:hypothetical protein